VAAHGRAWAAGMTPKPGARKTLVTVRTLPPPHHARRQVLRNSVSVCRILDHRNNYTRQKKNGWLPRLLLRTNHLLRSAAACGVDPNHPAYVRLSYLANRANAGGRVVTNDWEQAVRAVRNGANRALQGACFWLRVPVMVAFCS
jgi:hypothetical protein